MYGRFIHLYPGTFLLACKVLPGSQRAAWWRGLRKQSHLCGIHVLIGTIPPGDLASWGRAEAAGPLGQGSPGWLLSLIHLPSLLTALAPTPSRAPTCISCTCSQHAISSLTMMPITETQGMASSGVLGFYLMTLACFQWDPVRVQQDPVWPDSPLPLMFPLSFLPTDLLGCKFPFFFVVFWVNPLSPLTTHPVVVASLNEVFLTTFIKSHKEFFINHINTHSHVLAFMYVQNSYHYTFILIMDMKKNFMVLFFSHLSCLPHAQGDQCEQFGVLLFALPPCFDSLLWAGPFSNHKPESCPRVLSSEKIRINIQTKIKDHVGHCYLPWKS